ncbi:adenosylcobinamide-GDP ribazoletransferase [Fulvimarina manganoxydans]|nr:adenosylcobinamide-GDP ribazoletransferase [Fulvimarina manganoxydans]
MMSPALAAFLRATAFLTRLPPVARAFERGAHPLGKDVLSFPMVGLVAALPAALLLAILPGAGLTSLVAATLAVAATILITGALHEDGLGDVADGLFGHHGRERALAIMKDSRVGSYGALALILAVVLRIALIAELVSFSPSGAALAILGAAAFSRGAMVLLWASLPSADPGGLADSVGQPGRRDGWRTAWLGAAILFVLASLGIGLGHALLSLLAGAAMLFAFRRWLHNRLGGQTGDTLGAAQQLTEIAALFALCLG